MVTLSCGFCGHVAPLDDFCKTDLYGDLPGGCHQCPSCSRAIVRSYDKTLCKVTYLEIPAYLSGGPR
jgi:hypothetical protein